MEADVDGVIGAGCHERNMDRLNYRNGYRDRTLDTRVGQLQLRIPKLRHRYMQVEAMAESTPELNANSLLEIPPRAA